MADGGKLKIETCSDCLSNGLVDTFLKPNCKLRSNSKHVEQDVNLYRLNKLSISNRLVCTSWIFCVLFLVICCPQTCFGIVSYPEFFNVAKNKPISVDPPEAICGYDGQTEQFCDSRTDVGSVHVCFEKTCDYSCPHSSEIEPSKVLDAFDRYADNNQFGGCVEKNTDVSRPTNSTYAVEFKAEAENSSCGVTLRQDSVRATIAILNGDSWDITYHFYIKHRINDGEIGVIFDHADSNGSPVLQIYLEGDQLKIGSGSAVVTQPSWTVPYDTWTHVAVTVYEELATDFTSDFRFVAVYVNGEIAVPTDYGDILVSRRNADRFTMGQSVQGVGTFEGYLHDFKMVMRGLSNREVAEVYSGSLPETRIQSQCRCPTGFPMLKDDDPTFCTRNAGTSSNAQQYRIQQNAYPVQFTNDDKIDSAWISDARRDVAMVFIDLEQSYEVRHIVITFYSPFPNTVIIERQSDDNPSWQHWQLFSDGCEEKTGYLPEQPLTSADDVTCKQIIQPNTPLTYSSGVLTFDLLAGREGWMNAEGLMIADLRGFIRANKIRVTMRGHPYTQDPQHKYHGLYEISVNGTCDCNGNARGCTSGNPYQCECSPSSHTQGRLCDTCVADTYQLVEESAPYPAQCLSCDCNTNGTVNENTTCDPSTGQCQCKTRVEGLHCDVCVPGYFNLQADNSEGCTECDCQEAGVLDVSSPCDVTTGECQCKARVVGERCDSCNEGYYNLDPDNAEGCSQCTCHVAGTAGNIDTCNVTSGQCNCKTHVTGRMCDECDVGYYALSADDPDGCSPCDCDFPGAQNTSCHATSGACFCKANVGGATCGECMTGYYALDDDDFAANGCLYPCNCSAPGSRDGEDTCESRGGQCDCKANTQGRACDECKGNSFDFGASDNFGCRACACFGDGTVGGDLTCDVITGHCNCKPRVQSRQCNTCTPGYYGLAGGNENGCEPCECYELGTVENATCHDVTGQCPCKDGEGNPDRAGRQCIAYVNEVVPTFGPESGGTRVSIRGGYFGDVTQAVVALMTPEATDCPIDTNSSSPRDIVCVTRPLNDTDLKYEELQIRLDLEDGRMFEPASFTYMEDPVIESIEPLRSIVSGGIALTVGGQFLDSVAFPYLEITMVHTSENGANEQLFTSPCDVQSNRVMTCPTPEITLPEDFRNLFERRRKRRADLHSSQRIKTRDTSLREPMNDIDSNHVVEEQPMRRRRQVAADSLEYVLNSDSLQFYIGFRLDGVMTYRNMSETEPQLGILNVYINPKFEPLKDEVTKYQPYWPFNDDQIDIKGERLDYGAQEDDYTVRVGEEKCKEISLTTNGITCIPPDKQPDKGRGGSKQGAPALTIEVGNILFVAGYLKYEHSFWDNEAFRYGVIGGLAGVIVLIVAIVVICVVVRRRRRNAKKPKKLPHLDQFDQFDHYPEEDPKKKGVINAYDASNFHFPTLNPEKKPDPAPRPVHTLPPPSSRDKQFNGIGSASSYLNPMPARPATLDVLTPELRYRVEQAVMDDERLVLGKLILEGKIGNIHLGQLSDRYNSGRTTVLVKRLTEPGMVPREMSNFFEDTCILRDTKHRNVRKLLGVMIEEHSVMAVWPHAENGSLKSFITNDENMLTVGELIDFGQQVANGMTKLAESKVVLKDLAARNCAVTKELIVKVSDAALSRDKYPEDYWRASGMKRSMPVRWMALETLEIDVFTTKGDVWSFGILLWELLTRGCLPYPEVKNSSIKSFLMCGNRMDRPDFCPEEVYALMLDCWDESPRERPSFPEVSERISTFLEAQNTRTNLRNRGRQQVPSSRRRGHNNYAMLYQ